MMDSLAASHSPSRRGDVVVTALGLLGLLLFLVLYDQAFPSAAIDLKLPRAEIARRALAYLQTQGYDLRDYEFALTFGEDWQASAYLQRTLGIPATNRLIRAERLPIWYWYARWFRPLQKEEFALTLAPDGQVTGFSHSIMEDAPGASLSQDQARALAEAYLAHDQGWISDEWEHVTASSESKPGGRTDHHFEWTRRAYAVGESELRLSVGVQGDRIGNANTWIKVPEAFVRHFSAQSNRARFVNNVSFILGALCLGAAATIAYMLAVWRGARRWYEGLLPALAVAAVGLLAQLNSLPLSQVGYDTTQDYVLFWLEQLMSIMMSAGFVGGVVAILWVGGQQLGKLAWPRQDKILPRAQNRWSVLARSGWRGLMLGGLTMGYLVLFDLIATRLFGSWVPMGVSAPEPYATPLPFLGPLSSGLVPATTEELTFRLVGISALLWLLRLVRFPEMGRRTLALLIPGLLWAFAHVAYVRDPFYLRGIEVGIAAVLLYGLFFLHFDLTTTMMAHFTWNALLGALPMLRSGQPAFIVSGLVVVAAILSPTVLGIVGTLRQRQQSRNALQTSIAPATTDDVTALVALGIEDVDWASLLNDPSAMVLCLHINGEIAGVIASHVRGEGAFSIQVVYVVPAWRRRYGASTLVDKLCARLAERGAQAVEATTSTRDHAAIAFWASLGWRSTAQVFSRPLLDSGRPNWRKVLARLAGKE